VTPAPALRFRLRALFKPIDRLRDRIGFVQSAIALMLIGFLALLFIMAMSLWLGARSQYFFNGALEARSTWNAVSDLRHALQTAEASQRGYIVTGNQIYLAPYGTAKAQASRQLATVDRLLQPVAEARQPLDRLKAIVAEKFAEMDRTIGLKRDRRDDEALAIFRTNRGKALTDEANVFLSSMIRAADVRLTEGVVEVRENALLLRLATILSGILIVLVMAGVIVTVVRYTRALAAARDEVAALNTGLEQRVEERTAELARARDRAELLLAEVNHRVANSLALVGSMVSLQGRSAPDERARGVLDEVQARIYAIASVHKRIYSSGDVRFVALDEYLSGLLENLETSMHSAGHGAVLRSELQPVRLRTDASINLGVVVTEWVTNAFKYAYPDRAGEVRVRLKHLPQENGELIVEDDGVGRGGGGAARGTGLGTKLVTAMAHSMGAEVEYLERRPGTAARLVFPLEAA
jgi:two-component sensor histidine kinase/CHASE3 domain sensor protein